MATINVNGTQVTVIEVNEQDYVCLTDMIKARDGDFFIKDWLRNRNTVEFLGVWEKVNNPNFNWGEFDTIKSQAGLNSFHLSTRQWAETTNAIGIVAKTGRYGGTYAHKDIAFEFAMWISPVFKVYLIREFQRLKEHERQQLAWSAKRELSKINYRIHTDAIKHNLIPKTLTRAQTQLVYASEADVLNMALFGMTAAQWREANPDKKGNVRDHANINQLICLANMESLNAALINNGMPQSERLAELNKIAIHQMSVLENYTGRKLLQ